MLMSAWDRQMCAQTKARVTTAMAASAASVQSTGPATGVKHAHVSDVMAASVSSVPSTGPTISVKHAHVSDIMTV